MESEHNTESRRERRANRDTKRGKTSAKTQVRGKQAEGHPAGAGVGGILSFTGNSFNSSKLDRNIIFITMKFGALGRILGMVVLVMKATCFHSLHCAGPPSVEPAIPMSQGGEHLSMTPEDEAGFAFSERGKTQVCC